MWRDDKHLRVGRRTPAQRDADALAYLLCGVTLSEADAKAIAKLIGQPPGEANGKASPQGPAGAAHGAVGSARPDVGVQVMIEYEALREQTNAASTHRTRPALRVARLQSPALTLRRAPHLALDPRRPDGDLVVQAGDDSEEPVWHSRTADRPGTFLSVRDDGAVTIGYSDGHVLWTAGTSTPDVGLAGTKHVVYNRSAQRMWLIEADGTLFDTYPVSGRATSPAPGSYSVFSEGRSTRRRRRPPSPCATWCVS